MNIKAISTNVGKALLVSALFMALSVIVSLIYGVDEGFTPLLIAFAVTLLVGAFPFIFVKSGQVQSRKDAYVSIVLAWLLSFVFGMIPYVLYGGEFTVVHAWFESVSGYTTTGSTILNDIEALPKSLLFWRSSTHYIGGLGVVVFLLMVMPDSNPYRLKLTDMEFSALSKDWYNYRSTKVISIIVKVYLTLTVASCVALWAAGMSFFDAVNHAFSITATGGFSTRNLSIAAYDSQAINVVCMVFMAVSAIHFGLLYMMVITRSFRPFNNSVIKYYFGSIAISSVMVALSLVFDGGYTSWGSAFMDASFNVVSYMSTTGFANCDNSQWPWLASVVLIFVSIHCGCSGSTTGGLKVDRMVVSFKAISHEIRRRLHPSSVSHIKMTGHTIADATVRTVFMFITIYTLLIFVSVVAVMITGTPASEAVSGVIASIGSVGPGIGEIGSLDNYATQFTTAKLIYTFDMFLGRLEIFPVLLVISMIFKRKW